MKTIRWMLVAYAPLLFLAALAAVSFWLSPGEAPPAPPVYAVALQQARYVRLQPGGTLRISAARVEQKKTDSAELHDLRLQQDGDNSRVVLTGKNGTVEFGGKHLKFTIVQAQGVVENNGRLLTLSAANAVYDPSSGALSGDKPQLRSNIGRLSGDSFVWSASGGLKVQGRVRSVYHR